MYHRILEDADCAGYPFPSLVMPRSLFEAQLTYLSEHAHVLPLADALDYLGASRSSSKPIVSLTFDDGYSDNFDIVAPLLEARGLRGTFFVTAGAVQAGEPLWYDRAANAWMSIGGAGARDLACKAGAEGIPIFETRQSWIEWLKRLPHRKRLEVTRLLDAEQNASGSPSPLMTADQVRELAERGHEIGSHTLWHPILTTMTDDERQEEIDGAKRLLNGWTQRDVSGFCYPNGDFNAAVVQQLREAGHEYACTTLPGRNDEHTDRFQLRRIDVTADRVSGAGGMFDRLAFRAEISLLHEALRRGPRLGG
jgi:peptidoglycan/xylan/chitin deacetylase (PgdA/CDA1 family)